MGTLEVPIQHWPGYIPFSYKWKEKEPRNQEESAHPGRFTEAGKLTTLKVIVEIQNFLKNFTFLEAKKMNF